MLLQECLTFAPVLETEPVRRLFWLGETPTGIFAAAVVLANVVLHAGRRSVVGLRQFSSLMGNSEQNGNRRVKPPLDRTGICSQFECMPEQPEKWPRGAAWTLTHAHDAGQVAGIRCARCNVTRYYKPLELREVIGNVTIDEVRDKVRCQQCKSRSG